MGALAIAVSAVCLTDAFEAYQSRAQAEVTVTVPFQVSVSGTPVVATISTAATSGSQAGSDDGQTETGSQLAGAEGAGLTMCVVGDQLGQTTLEASWSRESRSPRDTQLALVGGGEETPTTPDSGSQLAQARDFSNIDVDCVGDSGVQLQVIERGTISETGSTDGMVVVEVSPE